MVKIEAALHPEEAELVWRMLNHAATELARELPSTRPCAGSTSGRNTQPATSRHIEPGRGDDSAESRQALLSPGITTTLPGYIEHRGCDDSAESWEAPPPPGTPAILKIGITLTSLPGNIEAWQPAGSVGSSGLHAHDVAMMAVPAGATASRSLLDRLLDEADALRDAEAAPHREQGSASSKPTSVPGTSVLHQRTDAVRAAFSRADALISLAQGYLRGDRPDRAPIEITLTIPKSSLHTDAADPSEVGEIGESFVSPEAARRLSCDAGVVEVVEDDHGVPLSVGRRRRTIAGALKRALLKRDTVCTYPGCTHRIFLEGHHIKHWADGGETSLVNAALLCNLHHRYVHEYGYTIELGPDQRPRFRDPHGRWVSAVPERPAMADRGWPWIRAVNEPLAIDADTIACEWDGRPVDYGTIVGHLVVADGL